MGIHEEAGKGQIIPEGSQSWPRTPVAVGPGLCVLPRTPLWRSSQNAPCRRFGE